MIITNFKQFVNENLLVPRNIEERKVKRMQMNIKLLSQEVIEGPLNLDSSFMDVDAKFVKLKKVKGNVYLDGEDWTTFPVWFKDIEITGDFDCNHNQLMSLENSPHSVGKNFNCCVNQLISLDGCSKNIGGDLNCGENEVELKLPDYVKLKGEFNN